MLVALACAEPTATLAGRGTCASSPPVGPPPNSASYAHVACNDRDVVVLVGRLNVTIDPDGSVLGAWEVEWARGADPATPVGPQIGRGALAGYRHAGRVAVDLNPGWADNNVLLDGAWGVDVGTGRWTWVGFPGPLAGARFVARRR